MLPYLDGITNMIARDADKGIQLRAGGRKAFFTDEAQAQWGAP